MIHCIPGSLISGFNKLGKTTAIQDYMSRFIKDGAVRRY